MSDNPTWYDEGIEHIWLPYTQMKTTTPPLPVASADGVRLTLSDGRELVDGIASWWTAAHGYNNPHIISAMQDQLSRLPHVMFGGLVNEPALKLSKRLADLLPGDLERVFLVESGSVSVEVALKMAVQYYLNKGESRTKFLSFNGGYHGDTMLTMSVADPEEGMHGHFKGWLPTHHVVDLPRDEAGAERFTAYLKESADEIAAVIMEPLVQGAGGMLFHEPETLQWVRQGCDDAGVLMIVDEIFTGFGRTGTMFAVDAAGIVPDMITLSKALTGGTSPLAACVARRHVYEAFYSDDFSHALMHGPTFMAHALGCAAANASLDLFESEDRLGQVAAIAAQMTTELGECAKLDNVADVRVKGAIGVVELKDESKINDLKPLFIDAGVWVRPFRNIVYLTPPLVISSEDLTILTSTIHSVLST